MCIHTFYTVIQCTMQSVPKPSPSPEIERRLSVCVIIHGIMYIVFCALYTLHNVQCKFDNIQWTMNIVQCILWGVFSMYKLKRELKWDDYKDILLIHTNCIFKCAVWYSNVDSYTRIFSWFIQHRYWVLSIIFAFNNYI